nr:hypothetical protein [Tanacetum cinerariifolium]
MEIKDKLDLDRNGTPIDATKYRSMIGALMYLTSSRPDIVHATCLCARYQAKPTEKHLKEGEHFGISGKHNVSQTIYQDTLIDFYQTVLWISRAERIYPGTLPLDRVEVIAGNPVTKVLPKLILPVHRIKRWRYNLTPAESKFKTPMLDHQDKYMMKAQVHVLKSSAISDEQPLPRRKYHC